MRLTDVSGPNALVNDALRTLEGHGFCQLAEMIGNANTELYAIEKRLKTGEELDLKGDLLSAWIHYTHGISAILEECFRALLEIGSANPEYVISDPAHWAYEFLRPHVTDILDSAKRSFLPKYWGLLDDKSETITSLLTDFYVEID